MFWRNTAILVQLIQYVLSLNYTLTPEELVEFRTGETRVLTIYVSEDVTLNPRPGGRSVDVFCIDEDLCKIISAPEEVFLSSENNFQNSFDVEIEATFLGITDLKILIGDEEAILYPLRLLRSASDHKISLFFTGFISVFVVIITFMMGTQLEVNRILGIVKRPVGPATGFVCQFGLMPTLGYLLATYGLSNDNMSIKLALFAVSICPGGGKSSFWTIIFGGNLDLSISMTFTQTCAALFMMPLWMSTVGKSFTDSHVQIPFGSILKGLLALIIPTLLGMTFTYFKPAYVQHIQRWIKRISWVAMIFISIFAIYANRYMFWLLNWQIILCGCALPWLGYATALCVACLMQQKWLDSVTIAIETGIQNIGIAMLLMMWCLPEPESDLSITIIFVVAIMTDKPLVVIWLSSKAYVKWWKKDTVQQVEHPEVVKTQATEVEITPELKPRQTLKTLKVVEFDSI